MRNSLGWRLPSHAWLFSILLIQATRAGSLPVDVRDLVQDSQLVFVGTVRKVGDATEAAVPVDKLTSVVRVQRVLRGPEPIRSSLPGQLVTVRLKTGAKPGETAIWFTRSWFYGTSLGVVEVGRLPTSEEASLPARIAIAEQQLADEKLSERLRGAQLVVLGHVTAVEPAPRIEGEGPFTEHDPVWWHATVAVDQVLKGDPQTAAQGKTFRMLFAKSTDVMWIDSPKLEPGEDVILICRWSDEDLIRASLRPAWTALDPLDAQPPGDIERIRRLIEAPAPSPATEPR